MTTTLNTFSLIASLGFSISPPHVPCFVVAVVVNAVNRVSRIGFGPSSVQKFSKRFKAKFDSPTAVEVICVVARKGATFLSRAITIKLRRRLAGCVSVLPRSCRSVVSARSASSCIQRPRLHQLFISTIATTKPKTCAVFIRRRSTKNFPTTNSFSGQILKIVSFRHTFILPRNPYQTEVFA